MATQLGIYNSALAELGQRELVSLSDPTEPRRVLDRLWDAGFVNQCLEQGEWNFAIKTVQSTDDPPAPAFGYQFRHLKPSDWVRTLKMSTIDTFDPLLDDFSDEGSYWYANFDTLYIQYISNHPSYGGNLDRWPESFTRYVSVYLARLAAPRLIPGPGAVAVLHGPQGLIALSSGLLRNAKSKDASNQGPAFFPLGTWAKSRQTDFFSIKSNKTAT